jgi:hypothetical protein
LKRLTRYSLGPWSLIIQSGACALALVAGALVLPAHAQMSAAKPTCAAGDTVVWENTSTKAYHLPGDKYYGNTKHGAYACKSAADSAGFHAAGAKGGAKHSSSMMSSSKMNSSSMSSSKMGAAMSDSPMPMATSVTSGMGHGKHRHHSMKTASPAPAPTGT